MHPMPREEVLEPNYVNTVRFFAQGLMMHDFERGKGGVLASFMEQVRYLQQTKPQELQRIIDEFTRKGA